MSSATASTTTTRNSVIEDVALKLPLFNILRNKRIVLASGSPRRVEILKIFGFAPEVIPSTFPEELNHGDFETPGHYAAATSSAKALEVYQRLVRDSPEDAPDLVIGADTIVVLPAPHSAILEKPRNVLDQMGMLEDLNGNKIEIITAVSLVQPCVASPGFIESSLIVSTKVLFGDNSPQLLRAYVECGEGIDRAGGFALQSRGGMLIREIQGDYNNAVGFPAQAFFEWLAQLTEDGELCVLN